jgi:hypothetical protein
MDMGSILYPLIYIGNLTDKFIFDRYEYEMTLSKVCYIFTSSVSWPIFSGFVECFSSINKPVFRRKKSLVENVCTQPTKELVRSLEQRLMRMMRGMRDTVTCLMSVRVPHLMSSRYRVLRLSAYAVARKWAQPNPTQPNPTQRGRSSAGNLGRAFRANTSTGRK